VFGGGYFQGNVDIDGGIEVGNTTTETAGTIRWTGADLEVYNGTQWVSLVSGEAAPTENPNYTDCINAGGNWIDAQGVCYFTGSSCPSGWSKKENYSTTQAVSCTITGSDGITRSCGVGSHYRENKGIESCTVHAPGNRGHTRTQSCSASQTEVGCTKN
jgi:hypothetical protein